MRISRSVGWALALAAAFAGCEGVVAPGEDGEAESLVTDGIEGVDQALSSGAVYLLKVVHSGKCADVNGASTADGANVQQWDCHGRANQQVKLTATASGIYELGVVHSGKCLDVYKAGTVNGSNVQQWRCNDQTNQRWRLLAMGSGQYQIQAVHSGKCLEVAGASTARGANMQQSSCVGRSNQKFSLVPVAPSSGDGEGGGDTPALTWRKANLTHFTSYPDPGSEECIEYNGCTWAGQFAFCDGKQTQSWVRDHNIAAIHSKDAETYRLKTLRVRQGTRQIDVKVFDMCADSDCSGCCTANSRETGFLIDLESFTAARFGSRSGVVDWACLDCN